MVNAQIITGVIEELSVVGNLGALSRVLCKRCVLLVGKKVELRAASLGDMIYKRKALYSACLSAALGFFAFVPSAFANGTYTGLFRFVSSPSHNILCSSFDLDYTYCNGTFLNTSTVNIGDTAVVTGGTGNDGNYIVSYVQNAPSNGIVRFTPDFPINYSGAGGVSATITFTSPLPPVLAGAAVTSLVAVTESGFASTTGTTVAGAVLWTGDNLVKVFMGSGLALLKDLAPWIIILITIWLITVFARMAYYFFRH